MTGLKSALNAGATFIYFLNPVANALVDIYLCCVSEVELIMCHIPVQYVLYHVPEVHRIICGVILRER